METKKKVILKKIEYMQDCIEILINLMFNIDNRTLKKTITPITIDEIDNFKDIVRDVSASDIDKEYTKSAFLEDDVENAILGILKENYKEYDFAGETRDVSTDHIRINGIRQQTMMMLKGRGVKGPLTIAKCGKNGDQLLKLAKNTFAQLYIIQHVNKIEPEVAEALTNHLISHSVISKIYICKINGTDTARLLKGLRMDLAELKRKNDGRKKKTQVNKVNKTGEK